MSNVHPVVAEYNRWKEGLPLTWANDLGHAENWMAMAFQHLVETLGKDGRTASARFHEEHAKSKEAAPIQW